MKNYPFEISSLKSFFMVLNLERPLIDFSVNFSIMDIFFLVLCPLVNKFCAALIQSLASLIRFFIAGYKRVD